MIREGTNGEAGFSVQMNMNIQSGGKVERKVERERHLKPSTYNTF